LTLGDKERPVPRLSIVIPCLGGASDFDGVLVSVLQNRPADCEIIVVHGEAYDDPYRLSGEVSFIHAPEASPIAMLNTALHESRAEVVHIIGCGLQTTEGWTEPALANFHDPQVASVAPAIVAADGQSLLSAGVGWSLGGARYVIRDERVTAPGNGRLRANILGPSLAAAFYRRDVLLAMDGFDTSIGVELADIAVALAIESLGRLHVAEPTSQLICPLGESRPAGSEFRRSCDTERIFWRHNGRRSKFLAMGLHGLSAAYGVLTAKAPLFALAGRLRALVEFGAVEQHRERLALAATRLAELETLRAKSRKPRPPAKIEPLPAAKRRRAA
jgi:hypothetical protein